LASKQDSLFPTDRFEAQPIGFGQGQSEMPENVTETDWFPPEAAPIIDLTCFRFF